MSEFLEDSIFILPHNVDISTLKNLRNELLDYIEKNNIVTLDGSIVDKIDAFGFQLILSTQKLCVIKLKQFSLIDASNQLRNVLELTGYIEILEDEFAINW